MKSWRRTRAKRPYDGDTHTSVRRRSGTDSSQAELARLTVTATAPDGSSKSFETLCRIDTPVELDYYRLGAP